MVPTSLKQFRMCSMPTSPVENAATCNHWDMFTVSSGSHGTEIRNVTRQTSFTRLSRSFLVSAFLHLHFFSSGSCDDSSKSGNFSDAVSSQRPVSTFHFYHTIHIRPNTWLFLRVQPVNTHVTNTL